LVCAKAGAVKNPASNTVAKTILFISIPKIRAIMARILSAALRVGKQKSRRRIPAASVRSMRNDGGHPRSGVLALARDDEFHARFMLNTSFILQAFDNLLR
jgi:hypothetical protein